LALDDYTANRTGLLLVDPYNDFLSDGGKLWPEVRAVAESVDLLPHLRALLEAARRTGIAVFYVPHRRWCEGNYDGWRHPGPWQVLADRGAVFAEGTWGSEWHPELARIEKIIVVGMAANTCIEATARGGAELGYHVTLVRDATAAVSPEAMQAAHDLNGPTFAHAILTTDALIAVLSKA